MSENNIVDSKIINIEINFDVLPEEKVSLDAKANVTMKVPTEEGIYRVLFEVDFISTETKQNETFIKANGNVIMEFDNMPSDEELRKEKYPELAMKDIVKKVDDVLVAMGVDDLSFSGK